MKTFFKAAIWMAAAVAGLIVWNVAPDFFSTADLLNSSGGIHLLRIVSDR